MHMDLVEIHPRLNVPCSAFSYRASVSWLFETMSPCEGTYPASMAFNASLSAVKGAPRDVNDSGQGMRSPGVPPSSTVVNGHSHSTLRRQS